MGQFPKLQDATTEVERLGELFLTNRERMVATDRQRNDVRAALTALRKYHPETKTWLQTSSTTFMRSTKEAAFALLQEGT